VFGCPWEKEYLHHTHFKAPEKLYAEKCSICPFSVMQPRLTLAGAKLRRGGARERWREPARWGKYGGRNSVTFRRYSPSYLHRPKALRHFPPFELSVRSYSPASKVSDGLVCRWWTSAAAALPPPPGQHVVFFHQRVQLPYHCEYQLTLA
jgi:hypothetical protein